MKQASRVSLLWPLILWTALCASAGAVLAVVQLRLYRDHVAEVYRAAEADAAVAEQAIQRTFDMAASVRSMLGVRQRLLDASDFSAIDALDEHIRSNVTRGQFGLIQVSLADTGGSILWSTVPNAAGTPVSDPSQVNVPLRDPDAGVHVSAPVSRPPPGQWSIQISKAFREPGTGRPTEVAIIDIDPVKMSRMLMPVAQAEGRRIVVRRLLDGALIARSGEVESQLARGPAPEHPAVVAARQAPSGRLAYRSLLFGTQEMAAFRVLEGAPVVVTAVFDQRTEMRGYWLWFAASLIGYACLAVLGHRGALALGYRIAAQRTLRAQAERDPLTGLLNRRAMECCATAALSSARAGEAVSVLLLDVDHFKAVNDSYGHEAGDRVLRDLAALVQRVMRAGDAVCRWGGEEVLVLLPSCNGPTALARAEDLRRAIAHMYDDGLGPVPRITASVGVAVFPRDGGDLAALVHAADQALYTAKRAGRNRAVLAESKRAPELVSFP